ncbi:hypothetical protein TrispH2_011863 [Trichoplax sp. H2]|nr:hypothetical protein TrispH2_011863 [Trichoplax sp. H2]|eukprot:RDD36154.1 hypothetical protein TrispH2_011863 [Trichoplax sp. H2]
MDHNYRNLSKPCIQEIANKENGFYLINGRNSAEHLTCTNTNNSTNYNDLSNTDDDSAPEDSINTYYDCDTMMSNFNNLPDGNNGTEHPMQENSIDEVRNISTRYNRSISVDRSSSSCSKYYTLPGRLKDYNTMSKAYSNPANSNNLLDDIPRENCSTNGNKGFNHIDNNSSVKDQNQENRVNNIMDGNCFNPIDGSNSLNDHLQEIETDTENNNVFNPTDSSNSLIDDVQEPADDNTVNNNCISPTNSGYYLNRNCNENINNTSIICSNSLNNPRLWNSRHIEFINLLMKELYDKILKYSKASRKEKSNEIDNKKLSTYGRIVQFLPGMDADTIAKKYGEEHLAKEGVKKSFRYYSRRKASKFISATPLIPNHQREDGLAVFFAIIAVDICRCWQQQISIISDKNAYCSMTAFVQDIVQCITRYLHKHSGRFGIISRLRDAIRHVKTSNREIQATLKANLDHDIDCCEALKATLKYFMEGLYCDTPKGKTVQFWVRGQVAAIRLPSQENDITVNTVNLLRRVHVKSNKNGKYYFPSGKNNVFKRIARRRSARIINYKQDKITKQCGCKLESLIYPNELLANQSYTSVNKPVIETENNETLCSVDSFVKLKNIAKDFVFNIMDRNLRKGYRTLSKSLPKNL